MTATIAERDGNSKEKKKKMYLIGKNVIKLMLWVH